MHWTRGWSYTDHVSSHALITWLHMHWARNYRQWSGGYHALIKCLIMQCSCESGYTNDVAIMHWSRVYHALNTWLIINWSATSCSPKSPGRLPSCLATERRHSLCLLVGWLNHSFLHLLQPTEPQEVPFSLNFPCVHHVLSCCHSFFFLQHPSSWEAFLPLQNQNLTPPLTHSSSLTFTTKSYAKI